MRYDDWIDEVVEAEPALEMDELNQETAEFFASRFESVDDAWQDIRDRGFDEGEFRLPKGKEDRLNCLGRTLLVSMYGELSGEADDISLNIYFDGKFAEDGTTLMKSPHVTAVIDGEEYGPPGAGKPENVPGGALTDLYKTGLGVQVLDQGEDIPGLGYEQLSAWGEEIHDSYSSETPGPDSDYLATQGVLMSDEAEEAMAAESIGDDDTDVYLA